MLDNIQTSFMQRASLVLLGMGIMMAITGLVVFLRSSQARKLARKIKDAFGKPDQKKGQKKKGQAAPEESQDPLAQAKAAISQMEGQAEAPGTTLLRADDHVDTSILSRDMYIPPAGEDDDDEDEKTGPLGEDMKDRPGHGRTVPAAARDEEYTETEKTTDDLKAEAEQEDSGFVITKRIIVTDYREKGGEKA